MPARNKLHNQRSCCHAWLSLALVWMATQLSLPTAAIAVQCHTFYHIIYAILASQSPKPLTLLLLVLKLILARNAVVCVSEASTLKEQFGLIRELVYPMTLLQGYVAANALLRKQIEGYSEQDGSCLFASKGTVVGPFGLPQLWVDLHQDSRNNAGSHSRVYRVRVLIIIDSRPNEDQKLGAYPIHAVLSPLCAATAFEIASTPSKPFSLID